MTAVRIEAADRVDLDAVCALLGAVALPTAGLREHVRTTLVARDRDAIVGCVALEPYGDAALLRSLAVAPSRRGEGLGRQITHAGVGLTTAQPMVLDIVP